MKTRSSERYEIVLLADRGHHFGDAYIVDHAVNLAKRLSSKSAMTFAIIDKEMDVTRVIVHSGKAYWAIPCACRKNPSCADCLGFGIARGDPVGM